jgi:hypothetical protein
MADKEWLKVVHTPTGTRATVTLYGDNLTVRWTVKTYMSRIKEGIAEARLHAQKVMVELREVSDE